jgi:hypothetical protein
MGYFDGLAAASFKERDGQHYLIGFGKPRRYRSFSDFEAARQRLSTYYAIGLPVIVVIAIAGRYIGYEWTVAGALALLTWLLTFGRESLISNSFVDGVEDSVSERLDRISAQSGRSTLNWLVVASCVITVAGLLIALRDADQILMGVTVAAFFAVCTVALLVMRKRSARLSEAAASGIVGSSKRQVIVAVSLLALGGVGAWMLSRASAPTPSLATSNSIHAPRPNRARTDPDLTGPTRQPPNNSLEDFGMRELLMFRGTCPSITVGGQTYSTCSNNAGRYLTADGRVGFMFAAGDSAVLHFRGPASLTATVGDQTHQVIDQVIVTLLGMEGQTKPNRVEATSGTCSYGDWNAGRAEIECDAETDQGRFAVRYVTDGRRPEEPTIDEVAQARQ